MAYEFKFPDVGEGIHEALVAEILIKVGDVLKEGDSIMFSVEQDKGTTEIPAPASGIVSKLNIKVGQTIKVGDLIVVIETGKASQTKSAKSEKEVEESAPSVVGVVETSNRVIASRAPVQTSETKNENVLATPLVRNIAKLKGIDLSTIKGTGPNGRIQKEDLENATTAPIQVASKPAMPALSKVEIPTFDVAQNSRIEKLTPIRKIIANAMSVSKTVIPETTLMLDVKASELMRTRSQLKDKAESMGIKLTYLPFITKAVTNALAKFPTLNARIDVEKGEMIWQDFINIGIAVDTPHGLIVPNIKNADKMNVFEISASIANLATKAREKKNNTNDLKGGTFSITNFGSVGIKYGTPVINYPETAILGVGIIEPRLGFDENKNVITEHYMALSISVDHRLIDGADAGRFLLEVKAQIEAPATLLIG